MPGYRYMTQFKHPYYMGWPLKTVIGCTCTVVVLTFLWAILYQEEYETSGVDSYILDGYYRPRWDNREVRFTTIKSNGLRVILLKEDGNNLSSDFTPSDRSIISLAINAG